jgi:hypothetical protein
MINGPWSIPLMSMPFAILCLAICKNAKIAFRRFTVYGIIVDESI